MTAWIARVLGRLPGRGGRHIYDLDVTDQWLLLTLARYGDCTYRRVEAELRAIRATAPAEVVASLLKLEQAALLERAAPAGLMLEERRFALSPSGRRLARLLPREPRSPTIFYL